VARFRRLVDATTRKASDTNLSLSVRIVSHHANLFFTGPQDPGSTTPVPSILSVVVPVSETVSTINPDARWAVS
jgi:hypothetical protein